MWIGFSGLRIGHYDLISGNTSEELLTIRNVTSPPLVSCNFMPLPWEQPLMVPAIHHADKYGPARLQGLVVDYITAPISVRMS
jgi:hypothetical protein